MRIEDYIPEGRENAISRRELKAVTGLSDDRTVRSQVKAANRRLEGKVILSSSSWKGYWISSDPDEIDAYLREQASRARTQAQNDEPARKLLASLRGEKMVRVSSYLRRAPGTASEEPQERWEV